METDRGGALGFYLYKSKKQDNMHRATIKNLAAFTVTYSMGLAACNYWMCMWEPWTIEIKKAHKI